MNVSRMDENRNGVRFSIHRIDQIQIQSTFRQIKPNGKKGFLQKIP